MATRIMNRRNVTTSIVLAFLATYISTASIGQELGALQKEKEMMNNAASNLLSDYAKALEQRARDSQTAGDLEQFLALEAESSRFKSHQTVLAPDSLVPSLQKDARIYHQGMVELLQRYIVKLDDLVDSETKAGNIEQAKATREEKTVATQLLAHHEQKLLNDMTEALALPLTLRSGLILWFSFDSPEHLMMDRSMRKNNAERASAWEKQGKFQGCLKLVDSEVSSLKKLGIVANQPRSIAFWVKPVSGDMEIVRIGSNLDSSTTPSGSRFSVKLWQQQWIFWGRGEKFDCISGIEPIVDEWSHIALTYDGSTLSWYVNGKDTGIRLYTALRTPDGKLVLGGSKAQMLIDEVMVWKKVLSADEISELYKAADSSD
jgi:hypothetical protein